MGGGVKLVEQYKWEYTDPVQPFQSTLTAWELEQGALCRTPLLPPVTSSWNMPLQRDEQVLWDSTPLHTGVKFSPGTERVGKQGAGRSAASDMEHSQSLTLWLYKKSHVSGDDNRNTIQSQHQHYFPICLNLVLSLPLCPQYPNWRMNYSTVPFE